MPFVFGPSPGPRQGPDGAGYDYASAPRTVAGASFLTDGARLERLLPPRCVLDGDAVVTVEHVTLHRLEWLAGRSYSLLQVKFPVVYRGREVARGPFLPVLWENRAEPIMTGREELGFAKLYAELPEPAMREDGGRWTAAWDRHEFARLELSDLADVPPPAAGAADGVIHHRYLPSVASDAPDVDQMVISPAFRGASCSRFRRGRASTAFARSSWEQLPTMHHIVNALADLPVLEARGGWLAETLGASDLSNQRVLA